MKYAVDSKCMKGIDDYTINVIKIPALVLMERAAVEIVNVIKKSIKFTDKILVVCGPGNNGGDGIAAGRILFQQGYYVAILSLFDENKASKQLKTQLDIAKNIGITIENSNKLHEYNIIIDAIFGVGLCRFINGEYEAVIRKINIYDNRVYSVDIPSGISADNGNVMNVAIMADETITFGYHKQGMLVYPGRQYCGNVTVADIGFMDKAINQVEHVAFYYEADDINRIPERKMYSHKGTYGKVLIIAGSNGMGGAAFLAAKAAYKSGAGLVKVLSSWNNREIIQTLIPEALFAAYDTMDMKICLENIVDSLNWASSVVIGPGLGKTDIIDKLLSIVMDKCSSPLVVDADAINLLAKYMDEISNDTEERLNKLNKFFKTDTILTPHLMELSRLMNKEIEKITGSIIDTADQCSYNNLIYVIKDAATLVTGDGKKYINTSGNSGMATGGSGDVLTGLIAGLIAQGMEPLEASCLGVYIHGLAGDEASHEKGSYSLMAQDIIEYIEKVMKRRDKCLKEGNKYYDGR